jgi:hypothetical protein
LGCHARRFGLGASINGGRGMKIVQVTCQDNWRWTVVIDRAGQLDRIEYVLNKTSDGIGLISAVSGPNMHKEYGVAVYLGLSDLIVKLLALQRLMDASTMENADGE